MSSHWVVPIVEGHGEVDAVPVLLRRIGREVGGAYPKVNPPIRIKAGSFLKFDQYFEEYVSLAANTAASYGGFVLILLDCEDDCPGIVGPKIAEKARAIRSDVKYLVALSYREYETWFLFAAASLSGICELPEGLRPPTDPEMIRGAKGWLGDRMPRGYRETAHQEQMTKAFSLEEALHSRSFKRLVERLCEELQALS